MLLILNLILSRFSYQVGANKRHFSLPFLFGFQKGGTYSINIFNNETDNFIFLIATEEEIEKFMNEQNLYRPCNLTVSINHYNITQLHKDSSKINGLIEEQGKYNTTIMSCDYFHSEFSFELIYNNPDTCLSYNVRNLLITNPIISIISVILFILWLINWIKNFSMKNIIHITLSLSFLFFVLQKFFFIFETIERNKSDFPSYFQSYRKLFQLLFITYFLSTFLSIENQLFLHRFKNMKVFVLLLNLLVSWNLGDSLLKTDYFSDDDDIDVQSFVSIFLWELLLIFPMFLTFLFNIGNVNYFFIAFVFLYAIFYVLFYTFYSIEDTFLIDYYVIFIIDIFNITCLTIFGYFFRLTFDTRVNYLALQFRDLNDL